MVGNKIALLPQSKLFAFPSGKNGGLSVNPFSLEIERYLMCLPVFPAVGWDFIFRRLSVLLRTVLDSTSTWQILPVTQF